MPTQKKFLDQDGLIQLLQEIEGLDESNIKDIYWSTDNADTYPTVVYKVGDKNGSPKSTKKITFKGDISTAPTGATSRNLTITIGGTDKTITYYDTPNTDEKVKQTRDTTGTTALPIVFTNTSDPNGTSAQVKYDTALTYKPSTDELKAASGSNVTTIKPTEINITDGTNSVGLTASGYSGPISLPAGSKPSITYTKSDGNITVTIGGQTSTAVSLAQADTTNYGVVKVDNTLSTSSTNPVQNKVVKAGIDAAAKTVKQTEKTDNTEYNVMLALASSSGTNAEAGYTSNVHINPNGPNKSLTVVTTAGTQEAPQSVNVVIEKGGITFRDSNQLSRIDVTNYDGRALETENVLKYNTTNTQATPDGARLVGYFDEDQSLETTVGDALDDLYNLIGGSGSGGTSLNSRVDALETGKADKSAAVGNITGTTGGNETANFSMVNGTSKTFVYKNDKVAYTSDTTTNGNLPVVLGNGTTPTTLGGVKYNTAVTFNPTTKTLQVQDGTSSMSIAPTTLNSVSGTESSRKEIAIDSTGLIFLTTAGNQVGNITNNGTTVTFTGTSAKAVSDGNGNNIVNTYATKTALEALTQQLTGSFQIVTTLPTADGTHGGIIYLIKDQEYGDTNNNIFKEYVEVNDGTTSTPNWKFELLGTTDAGVDVVTIPATGTNSVASMFAQYVTNA